MVPMNFDCIWTSMRVKTAVFLVALVLAVAGCGKQYAVADKDKPAAVAEKGRPAASADKDKPAAVADTGKPTAASDQDKSDKPVTDSDKDVYQALLDYISANVSSERKVAFSEQAVKVEDIFHATGSKSTDATGQKSADKLAPSAQLQNLLPAIPEQLATKFIEKLQSAGNIGEADIPGTTRIKPMFLSGAALDAIFAKGVDGWKRFHDNFTGVKSLVRLSRPAIDADSDLAVVYLGVHCGVACGEGDLFLLGKLKGKWAVVHKQRMWVNHD